MSPSGLVLSSSGLVVREDQVTGTSPTIQLPTVKLLLPTDLGPPLRGRHSVLPFASGAECHQSREGRLPFARGLLHLALVELRGPSPHLDIRAARNPPKQKSRLAQGYLHVEVGEAGGAVVGYQDPEPSHRGARRRVKDAYVGDRAANN